MKPYFAEMPHFGTELSKGQIKSSTDNLSNQDYNSNFVLFTETDGSIQPVQ